MGSFIYFFHSKTQGEPRGAPLRADGQVRTRECLKRGQWGRESPSLRRPRTAPCGARLGSPFLVGEPPVSVPYPLRPLRRMPSSVGALGSPQGPAAVFSMPPPRPGHPFGPGCARPPCEPRPSDACPLEEARTSPGGPLGWPGDFHWGPPGSLSDAAREIRAWLERLLMASACWVGAVGVQPPAGQRGHFVC